MIVKKTDDFNIIPQITIDWDSALKPVLMILNSIIISLVGILVYLVFYF